MASPCSPAPDPVRTLLNSAGMICRQLSLAYQEAGPAYAALQQAAREIEALPIPSAPSHVRPNTAQQVPAKATSGTEGEISAQADEVASQHPVDTPAARSSIAAPDLVRRHFPHGVPKDADADWRKLYWEAIAEIARLSATATPDPDGERYRKLKSFALPRYVIRATSGESASLYKEHDLVVWALNWDAMDAALDAPISRTDGSHDG